jgi:hypothetical protein
MIYKKYDETGKLIKETDWNAPYKFSIKELIEKIKKEYNIDLEDKTQGGSVGRRGDKAGKLYYEVSLSSKENNLKRDYILIDGNTGKTVFTSYYFMKGKGKNPFDEYLKSIGQSNENSSNPNSANSFLASSNEKGTYEKPQLGTPYNSPSELSIDKDIYQVYKGRYYTKAEWKEFHKSLPWWERLI